MIAASRLATPTISVVIPTLDEELVIAGALDSVGTDPAVEVVISDGGSRDGTVETVHTHNREVRVVSGLRGRGAQLNRGAAAARAPRLLFLHADCRLPEGWLPAVLAPLADSDTALGCFRLHTEPPPGGRDDLLAHAWWRLLDLRSLGLGRPYGDQALFLRRDVFDAIGGFPDLPLMEDLELVRRCLAVGRLARLPLAVRTTGRRFADRPIRARVATATFPLLHRLGVPAERLARWYGDVR